MNLVIAKFVTFAFVIIVISGANVRPKQRTLNEVFKTIKELNDIEADKLKDSHMLLNQTNFDCIDETLKLPENGEKVMDTSLADDYIVTATVKCLSDEGQKGFIVSMFDTLVYNLNKTENQRCNKVMLQHIDSKSKLIEHFDKDITNEEVIACDTLVPAEKYNFVKNVAFSSRSDISCYKESEIKRIYYITMVMSDEINEELITAEANRYAEEFKSKFTKFLSCKIDRLMAKL